MTTPAIAQDEHSAIVNKYTKTDDKLFMSIDEAIELSHEIARRISMNGVELHRIVGIANGALLPTKIIATDLNLPFEVIAIRRKGSVVKSRLSRYKAVVKLASIWYSIPFVRFPLVWVMTMMRYGFKSDPVLTDTNCYQDQHILLVDDAIVSGKTLRRAEQLLSRQQCRQITTAVITVSKNKKKSTDVNIPDYFISQQIQHFPWSFNHPDFPEYQKWLKQNGLETNQ